MALYKIIQYIRYTLLGMPHCHANISVINVEVHIINPKALNIPGSPSNSFPTHDQVGTDTDRFSGGEMDPGLISSSFLLSSRQLCPAKP